MGGFSEAIASEWFEKGMTQGHAEGLEEGQKLGHAEGLEEGRMETLVENVRAVMAEGMAFEEVIHILKLDEETVEKLRERLQ